MTTCFVDGDRHRDEADLEQIRAAYHDADADSIMKHCRLLEIKWRLVATSRTPRPNSVTTTRSVGFEQLLERTPNDDEISSRNSTALLIEAEKAVHKENERLSSMLHRAKTLGITGRVDERTGGKLSLQQRINRLYEQVNGGFKNMRTQLRMIERIECPAQMPTHFDTDPDMFDVSSELYAPGKIEELSPFQRAIYCCLHEAYERSMRRYRGMCCRERIVNGHHTRAWYAEEDIKTFVYKMADKQYRHDIWKDLTSKGSGFRDVINHMENCIDPQFPEIRKCRNMWSFRNGVFLGKVLDDLRGDYTCRFLPYESDAFKRLDPTMTSCKYFDQDFEDFSASDDWWDIPTPNFSQILDFQKLPEDVQRWAFVLGGRLCYEVGELDGFQIIPFYKGIARSGKSTAITHVFKQFFDNEDVKTLSNNVEKKFGLSSIHDGLLFIAPECRASMQLEQAEFQSIVSGEDVSIAVKHEKAKSIVWKTPGVMGGNEVPGWKDTGGSIIRRLVTFNFIRQVVDADAQLPQKLHKEIPYILQKCVRAYLEYSQIKYKNVGNIWDVLPSYFMDVRREIEEQVSPLDKYLNSSEVIVDPEVMCPSSVFQDAFMQFATKRCGESKVKFSVDFTRGPFNSRGITVEKRSQRWGSDNDIYDEDFFIGVTIKETTSF